jgi:hypothetical protein
MYFRPDESRVMEARAGFEPDEERPSQVIVTLPAAWWGELDAKAPGPGLLRSRRASFTI